MFSFSSYLHRRLWACAPHLLLQIKMAHDSRVESAIVALLRDRYEWRARVEASEEEQEERGEGPLLDGEGDVAMVIPPGEVVVVANSRLCEASK